MRRTKSLTCAVLALAAILALAAVAIAAPERASLTDIEDEVMCPICGTLLELSEAPQAERERVFIRRQIAAGRNKAEIKDALVAEYGSEVLATPDDSGFDLAAWLVPIAAFLAGVVALGFGVRRWRRVGGPPSTDAEKPPKGEDAKRLESDMARYDL